MLAAVALIFVVITIVGIIGNSLVLFVIGVNQQLRDSTNLLICNLALADLLFLVVCVPITAYGYIHSWHFSETVCYVTVTSQYVTCYVSVWTLVLLAYDRYASITNNRRMRRGRGVAWLCVAVWLGVIVLNSIQMRDVGVLTFQYNGTMHACVDSVSIAMELSSVWNARMFYWSFNVGAYVLPLALSILFYVLLVRAIWRQKIANSKSSEKMKRHATKMVFVVILTFGVCWFPQNTRFFLRGFNYPNMMFWERDADLLLIVQSTFQVIAYANSCLNPILYGALSERFRAGLARAWQRLLCCTPRGARYYHNTGALLNSPAFAESMAQSRGKSARVHRRASPQLSRGVLSMLSVKRRANSSTARLSNEFQNEPVGANCVGKILRSSTANSLVSTARLHERLRSILSLRQERISAFRVDEESSGAATCVRGLTTVAGSSATLSGDSNGPPVASAAVLRNGCAAGILLLCRADAITQPPSDDDPMADAARRLLGLSSSSHYFLPLAEATDSGEVIGAHFDFDDGDVIHL